MLSYQHAYHAGNAADVHKHALLAWALDYLCRRDKPLSYLETHAGRGLYDLSGPEALKTGESAAGLSLALGRNWFAPDHPYMRALARTREGHGATAYPGSPLIAALTLRPGDRIALAELHPAEHAALARLMAPGPAQVLRQDGFAALAALTPPTPRRGLVLIDPSYEVKADFAAIPGHLARLHRRWNVGVVMLWYPVLRNAAQAGMVAALRALELPRRLHHEVRFPPARPGHGMVGSGVFVVNAPFGLADEAARLGAAFAASAPSAD